MNRMNREMALIDQGLGLAICSGSTSSVGNGDLREIVEKVVGQDLDRRHRQEREEDAGPQNAEHVAEIGAGPHADVLEDVGEDLGPLERLLRAPAGPFPQNGVGRFLGPRLEPIMK